LNQRGSFLKAINIDIFSILIFLGLIQGLFLSCLLLSKSSRLHKILGIILLVISLQIFDFFSAYSLISLRYPHLIDISLPLGLAIGPLLYMFYFYLAEKKYPRFVVLHFIPFVIFLINQSFYFLQGEDFKYNSFIVSRSFDLPLRNIHNTFISDPLRLRNLGGLFTTISLTVYTILILRELLKILKQAKMKILKIERASLIWMRNFVLLTMILVLYVVINQLLGGKPESEYIVGTGLTLIIYYSSYHFIRSSFVLNESFHAVKYEKTSLSEEMKEIIRGRLITHMEQDKPFLNNMFSLNQLSKNISASPNHVSRLINEDFNQSYFEFISYYRIYEACKYLSDPVHQTRTIEDISFLVGYNSKTAFNKAFKKITGITPLHFKKDPEMYSPIGKHLITYKKGNTDFNQKSLDH
jgi:AraC-like DNA-binding protein